MIYETNRYDEDEGSYDIEMEYDEAGNTTVNDDGYQFFYDYENRLVEVQTDESDPVVKYTYNALGRRSQKHEIMGIDDDYIRYYYNNDYQVLSETDDNDTVLRNYIYGRGLDEVLVMADPNGADYYYINDHLNSPVALVDEDGDVVERYEYDAYGRPTLWEGDYSATIDEISPYGNPYYFTGRRVDEIDNGAWMIQYNRNRFYDYHTGRWMNQDPIGYQDGINLYAYVQSNPINNTDPRGLLSDGYEDQDGNWIPGDGELSDCQLGNGLGADCEPTNPDLHPQDEGPSPCNYKDLGYQPIEYNDPDNLNLETLGTTYHTVWRFVPAPIFHDDCNFDEVKIIFPETECSGSYWYSTNIDGTYNGSEKHELTHVSYADIEWSNLCSKAAEISGMGCMGYEQAQCYIRVIQKLARYHRYVLFRNDAWFDWTDYEKRQLRDWLRYIDNRDKARNLLWEIMRDGVQCSFGFY